MTKQIIILDTDKRTTAIAKIESVLASIIDAIDKNATAEINVSVNNVAIAEIEIVRNESTTSFNVYDYNYNIAVKQIDVSRAATLIFLSSSFVCYEKPTDELIFTFDF